LNELSKGSFTVNLDFHTALYLLAKLCALVNEFTSPSPKTATMNTNAFVTMIGCLLTFISASLGESPNDSALTPREEPISDLRTEIAGTNWKAVPTNPLRGGLAPILTFTESGVEPAGYRYEVDSDDSVTIFFNHGDSQVMDLSPDGHQLKFTFKNQEFVYEILKQAENPGLNLKTQLAGTTWAVLPHALIRPGLAATQMFAGETVGPQGYQYTVNSSNSITIHFNHGDAQLMLLAPNGNRLQFIFKNQNYEYELDSK